MSVLSSSSAGGAKSSSSHASTSIRSPMLSASSSSSVGGGGGAARTPQQSSQMTSINGGGGSGPVVTSSTASASPSAPLSPAMHTRGSLHLPAQPTVAPTTRRASAGPAVVAGTPSAAAAASPVPSASPPPVPVHPSPSQAAADANRKSSSQLPPPRSSPLPAPIISPPPSASPPPQLPHHPPATLPSTPTTAPVPNTDDWQLDSEATACHNCAIKFSILTRKHHCRSCGLIHCDNCSKYRSTIPSKHYTDKVRVCGKCYYMQKKQKRASAPPLIASPSHASAALSAADSPSGSDKAAAGAVRSESTSGKESRTRSSHSSSAAATAAAVAAAASASAAAAASSVAVHDLESQLSALHALHSSYQPEHHYLTSLLANAAQLEHTYVATIQCLYAFVQQQHTVHSAELRQRDAQAAQQQRQIEQLEDTLRQYGIAAPSAHAPLYGHAITPSHSNSNAGLHPLTSLPRARSTGESATASMQLQQQQQRSSSPQLLGSSYHSQPMHTASGPSSRASPSLGPLSNRPSSAADRPHSSHLFLFPSQSPPSLQQPSQSLSQQQPHHFDAASEEAYLEPEDAADSAPAPAVSKSSSLSFSSRHADYRPMAASQAQMQQMQLPQPRLAPPASFVPLSVLEPPSPPTGAPGHSRRASSNPNSASAALTPRERAGTGSNPSSRHGSQKGAPPPPMPPQPA